MTGAMWGRTRLLRREIHHEAAIESMDKKIINSTCIDPNLERAGVSNPNTYAGITPLSLAQYWCGKMPQKEGYAFVAHCEQGLRFYSWFNENQPYTTASRNDQKLFKLGSVVEFFIHPQGGSEYWEIHLSPNGLMMDLCIPDRDGMMANQYTWEHMYARDSHTQYQVVAASTSWATDILIPWKTFQRSRCPVGESWGVAVCRYNYPGILSNPELSATAPFTYLDFHNINEYHRLIF